jgi:phage shock protein A
MGLFQRFSDILSANLNEMVDRFEDPETMLKQAVREMESSIAEAKQEVVRAMASEKMVKKNLADHERQAREWQQRAEKAVQASDDALARKALLRRQEYDKIAAALRDQDEAASESSQTLRRQLEAMQAKLAEAKRRVGTLAARKKAADVRARTLTGAAVIELDTDAFEKFERLREKVERAEAEAEALRELEMGAAPTPPAEAELERADTGVEAELAALRRKLKG